jgi:starch synthase
MVSSECAPLAKSGGLADVVGALPAALLPHGVRAAVVLPRYSAISLDGAKRVWDSLPIYLGPDRYDAAIFLYPGEYPIYLVDCPALYDRAGLYSEEGMDYADNDIRFAVLARAALGVARHLFATDVFHCHDWQAGLLPAYLRTRFAGDPTFYGSRTVFTIHNLGYQGLFPASAMERVGLPAQALSADGMEFFGQTSFIKGGIEYADWLTTVSPTYSREIQTAEYGFGLDGALRARAGHLSGILNGVDYRLWNPATDPALPAPFSAADLSGKRVCKQQLLAEFGLPAEAIDAPLFGIVSRFTRQKGADILSEVAARIVENAYLVALGNGEPDYEETFRAMAAAHPGRIAVRVGFDTPLAHLVEAGADMFLMPSHYEPCGLNQIFSLRYGTIPVVRATGGLEDTIDTETGFKFWDYTGEALLGAVHAALDAFADTEGWRKRVRCAMERDFSWDAPAAEYAALYRRLLAGK